MRERFIHHNLIAKLNYTPSKGVDKNALHVWWNFPSFWLEKKSFWLCIFLVKSSCITLFSDTLVLQFPCSNAPSIYMFWRICWLLEGYGNNLILYDLQMFITTCVFHGSRAETWRFSSFLIILWWNLFFCGSSQSPLWYLSSVHKTLKKRDKYNWVITVLWFKHILGKPVSNHNVLTMKSTNWFGLKSF